MIRTVLGSRVSYPANHPLTPIGRPLPRIGQPSTSPLSRAYGHLPRNYWSGTMASATDTAKLESAGDITPAKSNTLTMQIILRRDLVEVSNLLCPLTTHVELSLTAILTAPFFFLCTHSSPSTGPSVLLWRKQLMRQQRC